MISKGKKSEEYIDISHIREADIAAYYLGVKSIPCLIASPLRQDRRPSFSLFSNDGEEVGFLDYSTREHGSILDLLMKIWNCSFVEAKKRIANDMGDAKLNISVGKGSYANRIPVRTSSGIDLQCRVREWRDYDIEYWNSYGISLKWLKYADVYPISHKIVIKDDISYAFGADKYAYAYVEFKEGRTTLKIYQPFNTRGYKWATGTDRSVWSLWTKIPKQGNNLIISSSLKDCLNLWANTGIPSICMQGEGYQPKPHVIEELKSRFKNIIVFYDNDEAGEKDSDFLVEKYKLKKVSIPVDLGVKDPSDLYKKYGKDRYIEIIKELLSRVIWKSGEI